jgi:hypothetical protein
VNREEGCRPRPRTATNQRASAEVSTLYC